MKNFISILFAAFSLFCYSNAVARDFVHVNVIRGVRMPIIGNPNHCTPVFGLCDILEDQPSPDASKPYCNAGFDPNGRLVLEFINFEFETDEWLMGDELVLEGDFIMSDETAGLLGGGPVIVKAGRYRLEYSPKENKKTVVFD